MRSHQKEMVSAYQSGEDALLVAPTGAGKTLAGFLPSLIDLSSGAVRDPPQNRLHTLYVSPLKALAADVRRNLEIPIAEMALPISVEIRTGDTSYQKRQRQRRRPPDILLTTPEQAALLLARPDAEYLFADLRRIVLDEVHALAPSKRGDLLCLGLARLRKLSPRTQTYGLSATVGDHDELQRWLVGRGARARLVIGPPGAPPRLSMLAHKGIPWSGHSGRYALDEVYKRIQQARLALIFVNTRAQAEFVFQTFWRMNDADLPIALHHGSLDAAQRAKVEAAMASGALRAVVCTSTLDLGIDWGDVDLVVNLGAPKGASRLIQRIGRANHRLDDSSRALLVPANRFEVLECVAAIEAAEAGQQDWVVSRTGALDVLCQHILSMACAAPFAAEALYEEIRSAAPYRRLPRVLFDKALEFVENGGYALRAYQNFAKIKKNGDGLWRVTSPRIAQIHRMNVGTIIAADMLKVRLAKTAQGENAGAKKNYAGPLARGGKILGEIEEYFLESLSPGDTFLFGGEILALMGIVDNEALTRRAASQTPKIPSYAGGKFPLSTYLAARVREIIADRSQWRTLPSDVQEWLAQQSIRSKLPSSDNLVVETFPRGGKYYLTAYPFEGRLAHQTLGMLLTRRLERDRLKPLGFVCNDYALAVWSEIDLSEVQFERLFSSDILGDDLEEWLSESALMKRTFRNCAQISGLVARRMPGEQGRRRRMTASTDLIYDVLRRHQPDHLLLQAAWADAATGLLDVTRLSDMLVRIKGAIVHSQLQRMSPLATPLMLEIGRETVYGEGAESKLAAAAADLAKELESG